MKFYHSFPRPLAKCGSDPATTRGHLVECGLDTLRLLIEFGILLTPERLLIPPNPRSTRARPEETCVHQERACFTLVRRHELIEPRVALRTGCLDGAGGESHAARFGPFSIGLDPIRARVLGMVPVIYFYSSGQQGSRSSENISLEVLYRMRELRKLLIALAHVEAKAAIPGRSALQVEQLHELGFDMEFEDAVAEAVGGLSNDEASRIARYLDTDRVPAWNLVDWLTIILNFFQIADSRTVPASLSYYQQREWRIVKLFGEHVFCFPLDLSKYEAYELQFPVEECVELRERAHACNPSYFSEVVLDQCSVLLGTKDAPFFTFVDEMIIPVEAMAPVERLLREYGLDAVFYASEQIESYVAFQKSTGR